MLNLERMEYILDALKEKRVVHVKEMAKQFYLSESTIRRDLAALEKEGLIRRVYGGAILIDKDTSELPYLVRATTEATAKSQIGMYAARLVQDDMVIFMDNSSTTSEMIKYMKDKKNLRIITNSANLAMKILDCLNVEMYCLGGRMNPRSRGFIGENAISCAKMWYADMSFCSSYCLSLEQGCMDANPEEVHVKKVMMQQSKKRVYLCDSSKFNKTSACCFAKFMELDYLVTEKRPSDEWVQELKKNGVKIIYGEENGIKMIRK